MVSRFPNQPHHIGGQRGTASGVTTGVGRVVDSALHHGGAIQNPPPLNTFTRYQSYSKPHLSSRQANTSQPFPSKHQRAYRSVPQPDHHAPQQDRHEDEVYHADPQLSELFRAMRKSVNLPINMVASHLQTTRYVIEMLEAGNLRGLPEWHETSRIIRCYAQLTNIDECAILRRVRELMTAQFIMDAKRKMDLAMPDEISVPKMEPASHNPYQAQAYQSPYPTQASEEASENLPEIVNPTFLSKQTSYTPMKQHTFNRKLMMRAATSIGTLLFLASSLAYFTPNFFWSKVDRLPAPLPDYVRTAYEIVVPDPDQEKIGVLWFHADDPRLRKGNKSPTTPK